MTATPRIHRTWSDARRVEQFGRLSELELQVAAKAGREAHKSALVRWRQIPDGMRVDLPSEHVFARVLGLLKTGATVKRRKVLVLELSLDELAELVGTCKATVAACVRWLSSEAIEVDGEKVAEGLGIVHRGRRTGTGCLNGLWRKLWRTSTMVLTGLGRAILGLELDAGRKRPTWTHRFLVTPKGPTVGPRAPKRPVLSPPITGPIQGALPLGDAIEWVRAIRASLA